LFERGLEKSAQKMGPGAMMQALESKYPGRYSLPQENQLRAEISRLFKLQKEKKPLRTKKKRALNSYDEDINKYLDMKPNAKPAEVSAEFQSRLSQTRLQSELEAIAI